MNPDGHKPLTTHSYRSQLRDWLARCEVRDERGRPVHLTPHQWRHTFATRLINRDVPQEVVRVLLDHSSGEMTAHYARLHDTTVRRHWEGAHKVNTTARPLRSTPTDHWQKQIGPSSGSAASPRRCRTATAGCRSRRPVRMPTLA